MANTMEDAPRSPAKEISSCWFIGHLAGESRANTAAGLAIKVKTAQWPEKAELFQATARERRAGRAGKKTTICARLVPPSKKCTRGALFLILLLPRMMPAIIRQDIRFLRLLNRRRRPAGLWPVQKGCPCLLYKNLCA